MTEIVGGLVIGFIGSLHCMGMCGPLVAVFAKGGRSFAGTQAAYHIGRSSTYAIMGMTAGLLGLPLRLGGFQAGLSITTGIIMMLLVLWPLTHSFTGGIGRIFQKRLSSVFVRLGRRNEIPAKVLLGGLNGLLPCGLVYVALAAALSSGSPWRGGAFMFVFGLGSVPALVAAPLIAARFPIRNRAFVNMFVKSAIIVVALLLILRGLSLGIPLLSPNLANASEGVTCH